MLLTLHSYENTSKERVELKTLICPICTTSLLFPCAPNIKPCYNSSNSVCWNVLASHELHSLPRGGGPTNQATIRCEFRLPYLVYFGDSTFL